jgi:group I intron endonuclease
MSEFYGIIYKATNTINNKSYIGQTTRTLEKRISDHSAASKNTKHRYFTNAIKKYGITNFNWQILEQCKTKEELDLAEIKWIEHFNTLNEDFGYNLKTGGSYGKHSDKTKKIIADGKVKEKNPMYGKSSWNKDKKLSEEHKKNLSNAHKGQIPWNKNKKGQYHTKPQTEEVKILISKKNSGENNGQAKLTWEIVREIRRLAKEGILQKELARRFNTSTGYMSTLINNKSWRESE